MRWQSAEGLRSVAWHHEGKYFVSSHTDGSLCTWPLRPTPKPQFHSYPHGEYRYNNNMFNAIGSVVTTAVVSMNMFNLKINSIFGFTRNQDNSCPNSEYEFYSIIINFQLSLEMSVNKTLYQ